MTAYTAPQHLTGSTISLYRDIYRANPFSTPRIDALRPLQRGAEAARTLARCRRMLERARQWAQLTRQTLV